MKKTFLFVCFFYSSLRALTDVSFEDSMLTSYAYSADFAAQDPQWKIFKALYNSYRQNESESESYLIPKLIHFIWLGSPLPAKCAEMISSWEKFHPDWTVRLWTDEDIPLFNLWNIEAFERANNYGEKSDIFRYEILYRYGGLYVDTDFECLKPFDHLHKSCEFYAGIAYDRSPILYNGLIGASPRHPILKACINNIRPSEGNHDPFRIMASTGPYLLTRIFFSIVSGNTDGVVVFPVTIFYPFPNKDTEWTRDPEQIKRIFLKPESIALHYWDMSWAKKSAE